MKEINQKMVKKLLKLLNYEVISFTNFLLFLIIFLFFQQFIFPRNWKFLLYLSLKLKKQTSINWIFKKY